MCNNMSNYTAKVQIAVCSRSKCGIFTLHALQGVVILIILVIVIIVMDIKIVKSGDLGT